MLIQTALNGQLWVPAVHSSISSQVVSGPSTGSPGALVNPARQATHVLLDTLSPMAQLGPGEREGDEDGDTDAGDGEAD